MKRKSVTLGGLAALWPCWPPWLLAEPALAGKLEEAIAKTPVGTAQG